MNHLNHMTPQSWQRQQQDIAARRAEAEHSVLAAGLTVAVMLLAAVVLYFDEPRAAECVTDTECAALCPAEDRECDGGPQ